MQNLHGHTNCPNSEVKVAKMYPLSSRSGIKFLIQYGISFGQVVIPPSLGLDLNRVVGEVVLARMVFGASVLLIVGSYVMH